VPHLVTAVGVVIRTPCGPPVRVTTSHLMATPNGFLRAGDLQVGGFVFAGAEGEKACEVVGVDMEASPHEYFGLNCLHSEVVVDGLRASTFGDYHALPSSFMHYVGHVVGISRASRLADSLANVFYHLGRRFGAFVNNPSVLR
jgi:hypothetical protein